MLSRTFGFLVAAIATATAGAYDIGCVYPENADDDIFQARRDVIWPLIDTPGEETPMVIYRSHETAMCMLACTAHSTPEMLHPLTLEKPRFYVPEFGQNAYSIVMCQAQCAVYIAADPVKHARHVRNRKGFPVETPMDRPDIMAAVATCPLGQKNCSGGCAEICRIVADEDYHPFVVGHYVGNVLTNYLDADGWNRLGDMQYSKTLDRPVPCTGNCRTFQDISGYEPRPNPRTFEPFNNATKYICEGDCRRWQPLQEGDEYGSLRQQEFVVPYIGQYATTMLREPTLTLEDPEYDLYEDSLKVIEELRMTSGDQYRKDAVEFFDSKLQVRRVIQKSVVDEFAYSREMSYQAYMFYFVAISNAEYDGAIQAWHEKVAHDLVRPTTVIKYWNDDELLTYGGDRRADGPVTIKARDFEAFIRVMPHAEFPSGSSCLCTAYMEATDVFLMDKYNRTITNFKDLKGYDYANMEELRDICGASRLWGGMHYAASVPAGEQVCEGLGTLGAAWADTLRNGAEIPNEWFKGDRRPVCGEGA